MPDKIPQSKRLRPKKGFDIITVKDRKGNEVKQRYVKRKGIIPSGRKAITDKPDSGVATGSGGRERQRAVDKVVDEAIEGTE